MRKLTKGEKRNILNQIRSYENKISKLERQLYDDENTEVLLTATKTIKEINKFDALNNLGLMKGAELESTMLVTVEHIRHGNKIICNLFYPSRNVAVKGVAICAEDEIFNAKIGMNIAELRATSKLYETVAKIYGNY